MHVDAGVSEKNGSWIRVTVETKLCPHAMTYKNKAIVFDEERLRKQFETKESTLTEENVKKAVFFLSGTEDDGSLICTKAKTV